jgi:hypothetical protein
LWLRQRLAQQMPKMIGRSRMDRDINRPQRASPERIRSLSTLSRTTLIAESEFGLAHGDRLLFVPVIRTLSQVQRYSERVGPAAAEGWRFLAARIVSRFVAGERCRAMEI